MKSFLPSCIMVTLLLTSGTNLSSQIEVQGHRGWRGAYPENTIPGFLAALDLGVHVLELDVVITADQQVLVSHEPWMNSDICTPRSKELSTGQAANIYRMDLSEIRSYDCGSKGHHRFPGQAQLAVEKPTLSEVFEAVAGWRREHPAQEVRYNIEIKRQPGWEGIFCPPVATFCSLVVETIRKAGTLERVNLQSFDREVLEYLHRQYPEIPLAYLVDSGSIRRNLKKLSFQPTLYSPFHRLVTNRTMRRARSVGIQVIPWTVNKTADMQRLIRLGVDGIITDYPDQLLTLLDQNDR